MGISPQAWLGRAESSQDDLDIAHAGRIAVTLGRPAPARGDPLEPLWHWGFFHNPLPAEGLGTDGHPARGGFLPPAENRNRMWAGGRLDFHAPLRAGLPARRDTRIAAIEEKRGRTGDLLFVTLAHDYSQDGVLCVHEEQDIVYRAPSPPKAGSPTPARPSDWSSALSADPVLLFRYSAVTFNGHRIHYDHPYATGVEGYAGLVVHGPLLATRMIEAFRDARPEAKVVAMHFRGLRPLTVPAAFRAGGRITGPGTAEIFIEDDDGPAQEGELRFV